MQVSAEQLKKESNQPVESAGQAAPAPAISAEEKPLINEITQGNILGAKVNLEKRKETGENSGPNGQSITIRILVLNEPYQPRP